MNNIEVRNMRHISIPYNMHLSLKSWQITLQLQLAQTIQNILMSKKKNAVLHLKIKIIGRIIIFHDLFISRIFFFSSWLVASIIALVSALSSVFLSVVRRTGRQEERYSYELKISQWKVLIYFLKYVQAMIDEKQTKSFMSWICF